MTRVHAFGDDPLQDLDAVGLVEAYRDGLSVIDVVEAAIARAHAVDDQLARARKTRQGIVVRCVTFGWAFLADAVLPVYDFGL